MFERFTDRARRVLVLAQEEARLLDQHFIGTEHILLGLIREEVGLAAQALASLGVTLDSAREEVRETIGRAGSTSAGSLPFTPRAKGLLELSLREALQLGHKAIDTEHLLLGLARQGEGGAVRALAGLGVDVDQVRGRLVSLMSRPGYEPSDQGAVVTGSFAGSFAGDQGGLIPAPAGSTARLSRSGGAIRRVNVVPMLYGWVVGIIDPAQGYMLRARRGRPRRRPARGTRSYGPFTTAPRRWRPSEAAGTDAAPREVERRLRQRAEGRAARVEVVMREFGPLLEAGVQDLLERKETIVVTPSAELSARIVRFRWGDSVLQVEVRRETRTERGTRIQMGYGMVTRRLARLPRAGTTAETLRHYLANDLAEVVEP